LLIVRPAFASPDWACAVAIASVAASKTAVRKDDPNTTLFWQNVVNVPLAILGLLAPWHIEGLLLGLAAIAIIGTVGSWLMLWAVRYADASAIARLDYIRLPLKALAALVLFHEMPSPLAWCGMALIVAGCVTQMLSER
jgi:drug/metabolite transporter (DMT)-like permease